MSKDYEIAFPQYVYLLLAMFRIWDCMVLNFLCLRL